MGQAIASGIFNLTGGAALQAGAAILLSYLLAGATALCCAAVMAEFARELPISGAGFTWTITTLGALRCAALCCAMRCGAVLCGDVVCCAALCCAVLCCAVLCCAVLCCGGGTGSGHGWLAGAHAADSQSSEACPTLVMADSAPVRSASYRRAARHVCAGQYSRRAGMPRLPHLLPVLDSRVADLT